MARAEVPAWALQHLAEHLPDAVVLNAMLCKRGVVLANTRLGAVVVTKSFLGEPRHEFLVNPRERVAFQCQVCQEALEFRRLDVPGLVHCGLCGSKYFVDVAGHAQLREKQPRTLDPARVVAVAPPKVASAPAPTAQQPLVFNGYTLHSREITLRNGGQRRIYFFAKGTSASGTPCARPAGYHVGVNSRSGLPFLKRGEEADGEDVTPEAEQAYRPQCAALTEEGHQCRNSARHASKYCASHFGYQPRVIARAEARREDTLPRVAQAPDTLPSVRTRSR